MGNLYCHNVKRDGYTLLKKGCYDNTLLGCSYRCVSFTPGGVLLGCCGDTPRFGLISVVVTPLGCNHIVTVHAAICPMNPHYYCDEPAVLLIIIIIIRQLIIQDCTCTMDKNKSHMMIIIVMVPCMYRYTVSHFYSTVILVSELSNMVALFGTFCLSTTPST